MTRLAGPIRQIGLVVEDVDSAMSYWAERLGVGPFLVFRKLSFERYSYRGAPAESPEVSIGIAHSGPLQVEIIQQHNAAPSSYRDFLEQGLRGFHHISPWFAHPESYDEAHRRLRLSGLELVQEGKPRGIDLRVAYFADLGNRWPQFEISESLAPSVSAISEKLIELSSVWSGETRFGVCDHRFDDPTTSFWRQSDMNVDSRVQLLLDKNDIREVLDRWCMALDRLDGERLASCFHPDASLEQWTSRDAQGAPIVVQLGGPAELVANALPKAGEFFELTHYSIGSTRIEVKVDKARSECYFFGPKVYRERGNDPRQLRLAGGRYLDRFESRNGEWRISHRRVITDWAAHVSLPDRDTAAFKMMPTAEAAILRRDRSDPSFGFWSW